MKRKVLEKNRHAQHEAPSTAPPRPYEASVLAPRTKWRAIVLPKSAAQAATQSEPTNTHDALVSGLFHGTKENEEYDGSKRRRLEW